MMLPAGTVKFEFISKEVYCGNVQEELPHDGIKNKPNILKLQSDSPCGMINYVIGDDKEGVVRYYWSQEVAQFGDQVEFQLARRSFDNLMYAVHIKVVQKGQNIRFKGFVSVLKEGFGFIETEEHDCELFFPFSSCNKYCDPRDLKLLDEVEYGLVRKNGRLSADEIKKLEPGTIVTEDVRPESYEGTIARPMKSSENGVSTLFIVYHNYYNWIVLHLKNCTSEIMRD
jgi:cold shock CspA family protein